MMTCKKCNTGNMVEKTNKSTGQKFMACDRWPECDNAESFPEHTQPKITGNITKSNGKDTLIIRQCCLKCAVKYSGQSDTVAAILVYAGEFEKWVNR